MDEYAFRPSVVITLKDNSGKSIDYLAVLEDITTNYESNLKNTDSQFSFIMSTQKFQGYPNLAMPRLPTGNFKMNMNIDALSSDQQLTIIITGTKASKPTGEYETLINEGRMHDYGFDDYRLDVCQTRKGGCGNDPIFTLNSLNNYLNVNKNKILTGGPKNAFLYPARIGSYNDYKSSYLRSRMPGPSDFAGVTGHGSSVAATFSYLAAVSRNAAFPPQRGGGWVLDYTLNMASAIYPLYYYLVNTKNFVQSSVIGTDPVPKPVPLQPEDGPVR